MQVCQVRQVLGCYTHCFSHGGQVTKDCWTVNKVRRTDLLDDLPSSSVDDLQMIDDYLRTLTNLMDHVFVSEYSSRECQFLSERENLKLM